MFQRRRLVDEEREREFIKFQYLNILQIQERIDEGAFLIISIFNRHKFEASSYASLMIRHMHFKKFEIRGFYRNV